MTTASLTAESLLAFFARPDVCVAVASLKAARHFAAERSVHVASYLRPLLATFALKDDAGELITDPKRLYLCSDEDGIQRYFVACDRAHADHGYVLPAGVDPGLVLEDAARQLERPLLTLAEAIIPGAAASHGGLRAELLELLLTPPPH